MDYRGSSIRVQIARNRRPTIDTLNGRRNPTHERDHNHLDGLNGLSTTSGLLFALIPLGCKATCHKLQVNLVSSRISMTIGFLENHCCGKSEDPKALRERRCHQSSRTSPSHLSRMYCFRATVPPSVFLLVILKPICSEYFLACHFLASATFSMATWRFLGV